MGGEQRGSNTHEVEKKNWLSQGKFSRKDPKLQNLSSSVRRLGRREKKRGRSYQGEGEERRVEFDGTRGGRKGRLRRSTVAYPKNPIAMLCHVEGNGQNQEGIIGSGREIRNAPLLGWVRTQASIIPVVWARGRGRRDQA